jgi:hypothetical protein
LTAVEKARVSSMLTLLRSIDSAQKIYFLTTGKYAMDINDLDIQLPPDGNIEDSGCCQIIRYENFHCYLRDKNLPPVNSSAYCNTAQTVIEKYYDKSHFLCWASNTDEKRTDFCKKLSAKKTPDGDNGEGSYFFTFTP